MEFKNFNLLEEKIKKLLEQYTDVIDKNKESKEAINMGEKEVKKFKKGLEESLINKKDVSSRVKKLIKDIDLALN